MANISNKPTDTLAEPLDIDLESQVEALFHELADLPALKRRGILAERCENHPGLRARVERLLANHDAECDPGLRTPALHPAGTTTRAALLPHERIGPYEIVEVLGEGGMGIVYLAEQSQPIRRRVALKIIKLGMDTQSVIARFETERESLALMNHPNVARVIDAGATDTGRPYFVMEHVAGLPITHYCDQQRLNTHQRLNLFVDVCHAVQHAHQKGIVHRDLKPSNVLVTEIDGKPTPKVIDFGIAKATQQKLTEHTFATQQGVLVGTPAYMSPEQADPLSQDIDTRADLYSLGVILYELLVGALPFEPEVLRKAALSEIQRIIREVDPPRPSSRVWHAQAQRGHEADGRHGPSRRAGSGHEAAQDAAHARAFGSGMPPSVITIAQSRNTDPRSLVRQIRGDLDWIVMKCLDKDRTRRYATAGELLTDIHRYLDHEPVTAGPPSGAYRLKKFVRRNKGPVSAAAIIVLVLAGGLVGTSLMYVRAEEGQTQARAARDEAKQSLDEAEQVTQFLIDMLSAVGPREKGADVTVREVLDKSAEGIGEKFADKPVIEGRLRRTLGQTYFELGLFDPAEQHLAQAAAIYLRELGPQDAHTLSAAKDYALVTKELGRFGEAEAALRNTLDLQRRVHGEEHAETCTSMAILAANLGRQGRYVKAEELYRKTLDIRSRILGPEHLDTVASQHGVAISLSQQGRHAESEELFRKAIEALSRTVSPEHPDMLGLMGNLASNLSVQGRLVEAEELFRKTLEAKQRVLSPDHSDTIASMQSLARNLDQQGRYAEAEELYRKTVDDLTRVLSAEHPSTLWSMYGLAYNLFNQGRYAEAEDMHRKTLDTRRRVLGEEHPRTLHSMDGLASALNAQGRFAEAQQLYQMALATARRVWGEENSDTLTYMGNLAGSFINQGRYADAEALLQTSAVVAQRVRGEEHPDTLWHRHCLAVCVLNQDRSAEAESQFREIVAARRRVLGADHPKLAESLAGLAEALVKLERYAEAEPHCREAAAILASRLPVGHVLRTANSNLLGQILCGLGRFAEAEPLLVDVEQLLQTPTADAPHRQEFLARIVTLYEKWDVAEPGKGYAEKAAEWRAKRDTP